MAEPTTRLDGVSESGVQSVERALDLLELLASASDWMGISELGAATGQPLATVHRLLATLIARGYAVRDTRTRRYALGGAATALAHGVQRAPDLAALATPYLREVTALSGETANLAVLERDRAVYVAQAHPARIMRMFTEPGNRVFLHSTGCGKVLLAYQPDDVIAAVIADTGLPTQTARTITTPARLWREVEAIRARGYALDDEEQEEGVHCLAVPVHDIRGVVAAAMSVSGPTSRLDEAHLDALVPHLQRISTDLSVAIAGRTDGQPSVRPHYPPQTRVTKTPAYLLIPHAAE